MNISFGKIIWKIFSKIISLLGWLFGFAVIGIFVLIIIQGKLNFNQGMYLFEILCGILLTIGATAELLSLFSPPWFQIGIFSLIGYFYYTRAYQFFNSFNWGIDPNFVWSLPEEINNFVGFTIQGNIVDFVFWLGFVYILLILLVQIKSAILLILTKLNVGFILEIDKEKTAKIEKSFKETNKVYRPISKRGKKLLFLGTVIFAIAAFATGIFLGNQENKKYPIVWQNKFPCTSILLINSSEGKKGTLDPSCIAPGTPTVVNFSLEDVVNKKMIFDVQIWPQTILPDPKFAVEIELKDPDKKVIIYISKEEPFTGIYNSKRVTSITRKLYFTPEKSGEYTLKVTPYDYYISSIHVLVRNIAE